MAAVCFSDLVANGGYSGYLPSDTVPNSWLAGNSEKILAGYPVDNSAIAGATSVTIGTIYEIGPQPYPLTNATDLVNEQQEVYTASWFLAYPGDSGGPLFVQYRRLLLPGRGVSGDFVEWDDTVCFMGAGHRQRCGQDDYQRPILRLDGHQ